MFKNIGKKIKLLAQIVTWIQIVIYFVLAMALLDDMPLLGLAILIIGIGLAWLSSFLLYGFGQLIDNTDKLVKLTINPENLEHVYIDENTLSELKKWREAGLITEEEYQQKIKEI